MVTIKDIARAANVSHTSVSRALNDSPLIKPATKKKIIEIAAQLHYQPNFNAKSLVLQKSNHIGLFFTSINSGTSSSFFSETVKGVNRMISENYNLSIRGIDELKDYVSIHPKRFDGIILMSQSELDQEFITHVIKQDIPLVVMNRKIDEPWLTNIVSNDQQGSFQAIKHLIKMGHKNIAMIEGMKGFQSSMERREGYLKALIHHHIPIRNEYIIQGHYDVESGHQAMKQLLSLPQPPSAVFCANDDMAIGSLNAAYEAGLRVPDDVSVIGFDDIEFAQYSNPPLSTVKRPIEKISALGTGRLLDVIEKQASQGGRIVVDTELISRKSVSDGPRRIRNGAQ